ncbi:polysaccharide deacetylase family protein [Salipaludibacillus daqingensis]|uniref:polysaccharide deacetylase family protein n=1 Tax=Salipaludibacillus daqingensis TaxID=3041001 RepID=UPI0024755AAE|nr:polysaccharide deacetylase family protein [Salipaludibacillus daqingensis]
MLKRVTIQLGTLFLLVMMTLSTGLNPITNSYIIELKGQAEDVMKEENPLYMEILRQKQKYDEAAIDAKVDPVWKAIPGYNGLRVDVQQSFENMKEKDEFQQDQLVLEEITPEVTLQDLPTNPIYRGNKEKRMAGFMINVAWGNEYIPKMLKVLDKHQVKATFFLDGSWVKNNPNLAMMIKEEGHEIGNHAYSHPDMQTLSRERIRDEILRTNEIIDGTLQVEPKWFAPPSGSYHDQVVKIAREFNLYTVLWTVDTVDWKKPNPSQMADQVVSKVEPGSLILMHPTASSVNGLEQMINGIQQKDLKLGTVSDVLSENRVAP